MIFQQRSLATVHPQLFHRVFRPLMHAGIVSVAFASFACVASASSLAVAPPSVAQPAGLPEQLKGVGITDKSGAKVPVDELSFKDENGADVKLSKYFTSGKPVLLALAYYECPNLCTFVLNGLADSIKPLEWQAGKQFEIVTVSINPRETPALAKLKKANYIAHLGKPEAAAGWHFLTGKEAAISKLAESVGYGYKWVPEDKQYAHGAGLFVLTPDGRISHTFYGIEYKQQDLRLSLLEASNGKIGTIADRILLFCYHYDPKTGKYSVYVTQLMQAGGAGTVVAFGGYLAVFWRRQRRRSKKEKEST
jgi:protein SCO1/2